MNKVIGICLVLISCLAKAELKVAVVDMHKIVQETSAGKKAKSIMKEEFNKKKLALDIKESDLKNLEQELEKKKAVLSDDAIKKKQKELQEEMIKFRELVNKSQFEMQKRQQELTSPILEKIKKVVDRITDEKNYDLVLEEGAGLIKFSKKLDISDEVISQFEREK